MPIDHIKQAIKFAKRKQHLTKAAELKKQKNRKKNKAARAARKKNR